MSSSAKKIISKIMPKRKSRSRNISSTASSSGDDDRPRKKKSSLRAKVQNVKPKLNPPFRKKRSNINVRNSQGLTPLHQAVINGNVEGVRELLSRKDIDINAEDRRHRTPLIIACENNQTDIALKLIKHKADLTVWDENFDTPLHIALRKGNRIVADRMIDRAMAKGHLMELVTEPNWNWVAPIHEAARVGHTDLIRKFLDEDLKVEKHDEIEKHDFGNGPHDDRNNVLGLRGENDDSLLHIASSNGHVDLVELLVQRGAKIDSSNWDLRTPLHLSCIANQRAVVEYLVEKKANLEKTDVDYHTPLQVAANAESFDVIIALLDRYYNSKGLTQSTTKDNHDTVTIVSEGGKSSTGFADGNELNVIEEEDDVTVIDGGHDDRVDERDGIEGSLMDITDQANDDVNGDSSTVQEGLDKDKSMAADEMVDDVKENQGIDADEDGGVDPVVEQHEPTTPGVVDDKTSIATFNVEQVPEPVAQTISEEKEESLAEFIEWVVIEDRAKVLKLLLRYKSKLNDVRDDDIKKYMRHAAMNGHTETLGVLIRWKPDVVDFYDDDGKTPLHHAAEHGHDGVVQELTKASASVNATTIGPVKVGYNNHINADDVMDNTRSSKMAHERTALHLAAMNGFTKPVRSLIKAGADINFPDKHGVTPLHLACIGGHLDALKQLVGYDVDLLSRDHRGRNCMEYATDGGNENVAYYLLSHRDWKQIMSSSSWDEYHKDRSTPMKKLIEKMPDVAQAVMDKCIEVSPYADRKDEEFWIEFYYELMEDSFSLWGNNNKNMPNTNNNNDSIEDETPLTETQSTPANVETDTLQEGETQEEDGETQHGESEHGDNQVIDENQADDDEGAVEKETSFTDQPDDSARGHSQLQRVTG
nr:serine/threonine-protein phosphatase 6 regulatory ankyrin repeat subunit B-like [Lytechinus pictus]